MLITGLAWCRLLVEYCDVFISCLDSHSDGTHSLQRTHWWASDVMLHFSKSILMNKQSSLSLHLLDCLRESTFSTKYISGRKISRCTKLELCIDMTLAVNINFVIVWTQGKKARERDWLFPCGLWPSDPDSCGIYRILENSWRRNVIWRLMFWNLLASRSQTQHVLACSLPNQSLHHIYLIVEN